MITPEAMPQLFNSFTQADNSTTRKYGGTGLGLAISKELVQLMGGSILVNSIPDVGSEFSFTLNFAPAEIPLLEPVECEFLLGKRILLVEDNPSIVQQYLKDWHLTVTVATDLKQTLDVLDIADPELYALVIIDVKLEGLTLVQRIRSDPRWKHLPLLMLTSTAFEGDNAALRASGCNAHLFKPLRRGALLDMLQILGRENINEHATYGFPGLKVLLAEDHPINQEVSKAVLESLGCQVRLAENGEIAVKLFLQEQPDVILMDCQMPVMSGYTATQEIRHHEQNSNIKRVPIIALTALAFPEDRQKCLDAGMDDYLAKPLQKQLLLSVLQHWLPNARYEQIEQSPVKNRNVEHTLDIQVLEQLRKMKPKDGEALVQKVVGMFLQIAPKQIHTIREALLENNCDAIRHAAHSLKSASANVGAMRLSELSRKIEFMAKDGKLDFEITELADMEKAFFDVERALRDALDHY